MTDCGTGGSTDCSAHRTGHEGPGDRARCGLLFDGLAAGGGAQGSEGQYKGDGKSAHDGKLL